MFVYAGTQVEPVITDSEVQCEITLIPTCSTPLCSLVKSVGCHSDDDNKDQDYIPSNLFGPKSRRKRRRRRKKVRRLKKMKGTNRSSLSSLFFQIVTCSYFFFCYRIIYNKKGSVPPQSESKFIVFLSCLL